MLWSTRSIVFERSTNIPATCTFSSNLNQLNKCMHYCVYKFTFTEYRVGYVTLNFRIISSKVISMLFCNVFQSILSKTSVLNIGRCTFLEFRYYSSLAIAHFASNSIDWKLAYTLKIYYGHKFVCHNRLRIYEHVCNNSQLAYCIILEIRCSVLLSFYIIKFSTYLYNHIDSRRFSNSAI